MAGSAAGSDFLDIASCRRFTSTAFKPFVSNPRLLSSTLNTATVSEAGLNTSFGIGSSGRENSTQCSHLRNPRTQTKRSERQDDSSRKQRERERDDAPHPHLNLLASHTPQPPPHTHLPASSQTCINRHTIDSRTVPGTTILYPDNTNTLSEDIDRTMGTCKVLYIYSVVYAHIYIYRVHMHFTVSI